jgi:NAD(P)-dependent dehydrogenase (short-subunit alcohol dehydrogenase family)
VVPNPFGPAWRHEVRSPARTARLGVGPEYQCTQTVPVSVPGGGPGGPLAGLLSSTTAHLQAAYAVDVISGIVVTQVAAPAMRAAGSGTILVTGGGFADHPIPALATMSLGKAALRSAATMLGADLAPDGIRVATLTIAGQIAAGTSFDPERIAERYWEVVHAGGPWQAELRFTGR